MDWLMDTLLTQHWKTLWSTNPELPPVFRWEVGQPKGPLRLFGVKQPPIKVEHFSGWVYALDRVYHTVTVYYQQNYQAKTLGEISLADNKLPAFNSPLFHQPAVDEAIVLRYALDFALKLYQEGKT
jgi:hypothetical protein